MITIAIAEALGTGEGSDHAHLVRVHVPSETLSDVPAAARPEGVLVRRLLNPTSPVRLFVHGPAGAGKTSLIVRALAEASAYPTSPETLILRCGQRPDSLKSEQAFLELMLETIQTQSGSFATVDRTELQAAMSTTTTVGASLNPGLTVGPQIGRAHV